MYELQGEKYTGGPNLVLWFVNVTLMGYGPSLMTLLLIKGLQILIRENVGFYIGVMTNNLLVAY